MFSTLNVSAAARQRRGVSFSCALALEVLVVAAVYLVGILSPIDLSLTRQRHALVWLPDLAPPEKHVVEPQRRIVRLAIPKPEPVVSPKLVAPPPIPEAPKIRAAVPAPPVPPPPFAPPTPQPLPPPPKAPVVVHTGLFGDAPEPVTTKRPAQEVQTGGFGSPQGLPGRAQGDSVGTVAKLGSFGLPDGPGVGNGTGGAHGVPGVVASAGFGSGVASPGDGRPSNGGGGPKVSLGGFTKAEPATPSSASGSHTPPPVEVQPVEILYKPNPVYTEEARRLGIQGEVTLSVVFQASGAIRVLGVVKSLGHGLDQAAEDAAAQIRFKPAQRDGKPADFPATLRIEFRLAG